MNKTPLFRIKRKGNLYLVQKHLFGLFFISVMKTYCREGAMDFFLDIITTSLVQISPYPITIPKPIENDTIRHKNREEDLWLAGEETTTKINTILLDINPYVSHKGKSNKDKLEYIHDYVKKNKTSI